MQLQDYIFYYHSNYLKNYKEIMRAQRARNALVSEIRPPRVGGLSAWPRHRKFYCTLDAYRTVKIVLHG